MERRRLACFIAMALVAAVTLNPVAASAGTGKIKSVNVTNIQKKTLTLSVGESFLLKTKVKTSGQISKRLKFKSSRTKVASVSKKGLIKAKKAGTAQITVSAKANAKKKAVIRIAVDDKVKVNKITLNKTELTLIIGGDDGRDEFSLVAGIAPVNATNKELRWTSSDTDVVEVDEDGYVVGIEEGEAIITATAKDGSGAYAKCLVKVIDVSGDSYWDYDDDYDDSDDDDDWDDDDWDGGDFDDYE